MVPPSSPRVSRALGYSRTGRTRDARPKGLSPARAPLSSGLRPGARVVAPAYPASPRFGLLPLRSPLLGESRLISFPPGTWMFRFPGLAPALPRVPCKGMGGSPIRTSRGQGLERLDRAFRRFPRPSSPADAWASPARAVCVLASACFLCSDYSPALFFFSSFSCKVKLRIPLFWECSFIENGIPVELRRFELLTPRMQIWCSTS